MRSCRRLPGSSRKRCRQKTVRAFARRHALAAPPSANASYTRPEPCSCFGCEGAAKRVRFRLSLIVRRGSMSGAHRRARIEANPGVVPLRGRGRSACRETARVSDDHGWPTNGRASYPDMCPGTMLDATGLRYEIVSVNAFAAVSLGLDESLTDTPIGYSPGASLVLGVPDRTPVLLSFSPFGSLAVFFHL